MIWVRTHWRSHKFALTFASVAALVCVAVGVSWLMLPSPGGAIYNEMHAASHDPNSMIPFRKWVPAQKLLISQSLHGVFEIQINNWQVLLPSTPIEVSLIPAHGIDGLPDRLAVCSRENSKWGSVAMRRAPNPWRSWAKAHHDVPVIPPSDWYGWKVLARTKPPPGEAKLTLGDFYGFLPLGASGLRIDGIWPGHDLRSLGFAYPHTGVTWLHTRLDPLLRHLVQPYALGHGFYDIQKGNFSTMWWGLVHAGVPPWRASHVIESAAKGLLGRSDMQLMRMALRADVSQLSRAATAAKAVQTAILVASVPVTGHEVFWAKTRSGGYVCFWLQTPYAIMAQHFSREGVAFPDVGVINCNLTGLSKARHWASRMRNTVEKVLPFFVAGPPWEDTHATEKGKD